MSYDLLVFDPMFAPRERTEFMVWYRDLVQWKEDRDYNSPMGMSGKLNLFFDTIRDEFPAMNGPYAYDFIISNKSISEPKQKTLWEKIFSIRKTNEKIQPRFNEALVTDYCLATNAIYMCFAWSVADQAYNRVFNIALSTGVGFFNVSANDGEILHDAKQFEDFMGL
jgi:hypothetical protein